MTVTASTAQSNRQERELERREDRLLAELERAGDVVSVPDGRSVKILPQTPGGLHAMLEELHWIPSVVERAALEAEAHGLRPREVGPAG